MKDEIFYVGIDVAKSKLDICFYNGNYKESDYFSIDNNLDGFYEFYKRLVDAVSLDGVRVGFEATSTYMYELQKFLDGHFVKYILINPKKLHHFIKYSLTQNKTDKQDSFYIAHYITTLSDGLFCSSYSNTKTLYKSYVGYLNLITKTETHLKGLSDSVLFDAYTSESLQSEILKLKKSLNDTRKKTLNEVIEVMKFSMPEYAHIKNDLDGVGDKTLISVLPLIYDISDKYSIKQLQSYIGLNPVFGLSGSSVNKKTFISKAGNHEARKNLYMSAVSSIKNNELMKEKYERLLAKGKPKKVALIAVSAHIFRAIVYKLNHYKGLSK